MTGKLTLAIGLAALALTGCDDSYRRRGAG